MLSTRTHLALGALESGEDVHGRTLCVTLPVTETVRTRTDAHTATRAQTSVPPATHVLHCMFSIACSPLHVLHLNVLPKFISCASLHVLHLRSKPPLEAGRLTLALGVAALRSQDPAGRSGPGQKGLAGRAGPC